MRNFWQDLRFGTRMLTKAPAFAVIVVLILAFGIGANTVIFSVVHAVLLRHLPFHESERLVLVKESLPKLGWNMMSVSPAEIRDYREGNRVFSEIAAFTPEQRNLTGQGEPARIQIARVSASLFPLLGVWPSQGRVFRPEEDQLDNVVILSHELWQHYFGADAVLSGQVVRLDDHPYTVIGVMPPHFQFPYNGDAFDEPPALWVPLALTDEEKRMRGTDYQYGLIGRLKPGISMAQAQADIDAVAARFQQDNRKFYPQDNWQTATVVGLQHDVVKNVRLPLLLLFGAVGLVLLIACANIANLLLARAITRQREIAIRCALGAGKWRIARQLLTESLLLAVLGAAAGLVLAIWSMKTVARFAPADLPGLQELGLEPAALAFTLVISLAASLGFGAAPALQGIRPNLNSILKNAGERSGYGGKGMHLRSSLVVFETASALVLLVGAGLLISSFVRVLRVPLGFNPEGVVIAQTALSASRYQTPEQRKNVQRRMLERLSALPGVQAAGVTTNLPLVGDRGIGFVIEGKESQVNTAYNAWVSNDYFQALGIPLRSGRSFNDGDRENTPAVVVINETMQRRFWPNGDALGKRLGWGGWQQWLTIVGVVSDVKVSSLEAETMPAIYMPIFQIPRARENVIYVIRSSTDAASLAVAVRREISAVDAEVPVFDVRTMNQVIAASVSSRRFLLLLVEVFAGAALVLAGFGLYGVVAYNVTQRIPEIGLRMALGARPADVLRLIIGQGMRPALLGMVIGLAASLVFGRFLQKFLFGVSARDPLTLAMIAGALLCVALTACWVPARRAMKADPMAALKAD